MSSGTQLDTSTARAPTRKADAVAAAVLSFLKSRPGELITLDELIEVVNESLNFTTARSGVHSAVSALVRREDNPVCKAWRGFYVWSPDGVVPPPPASAQVRRMIEFRAQGQSLDEIGREFGITRERVRQILERHGGPTAAEVRATRIAEAAKAKQADVDRVHSALRDALSVHGAMSTESAAAAAGLEQDLVSRYWPEDLAHLRLWGSGNFENRWSDEDILNVIREAALYEYPLTTNAYAELLRVGQITGPSLARIGQRFGYWSVACEAAGVVAGQTCRDNYQSRWSDADLLQVVRQYLLDPTAPNSAHRFDEWKRNNAPDGPSFQTVRNRFGSWTEVKRRAVAMEEAHGE